MKRFMMWLIALAAFAGSALYAQDYTGTWQGTLHAGQDLRCVVQITQADGALKGKFYSIDQGGTGMTTTTMTVQNGVLKFTIVGLGATFEGKLSPDNKTAVGTWSQGGPALPFTLEHVTAEAAWPIPVQPAALKNMPPDAVPGYEVATIKLSKPDQQGRGFNLRGRHLVTTNTTVTDLIIFSYGLHAKQVIGGPDWLSTQHFDLDVLPDMEGLPSIKQAGLIFRKLLADRFQLKFHQEKKELSVYVLSTAKTGPKLIKSGSDPSTPPGLGGPPGRFRARNATITEFAGWMQTVAMDRPVVDQTGLTDRFDWTLNWTPDESQFGGRVPPPSAENTETYPSLFTAIQEQIGLKLEATKAPVDVYVIDHVEKPSEN
ncbi:MAG TPA: TIGR03435 family protein [Acidobacteriaceae bacterium]|jgi:uncharacterized protein (TIGR03435 family)